jgi:hypothetical protein
MLGTNGVNSIPDLEGLMPAEMVWVGALRDSHGSRIVDPEAIDAFKHEGGLDRCDPAGAVAVSGHLLRLSSQGHGRQAVKPTAQPIAQRAGLGDGPGAIQTWLVIPPRDGRFQPFAQPEEITGLARRDPPIDSAE